MDVNYIIVQAGGKGTRMERLARNKPKALVPVPFKDRIIHFVNRKHTEKTPENAYIKTIIQIMNLESFAAHK